MSTKLTLPDAEPVNLYAQKRRAARLAVVQVLYQMEVTGRGWEGAAREFMEHSFDPDMPRTSMDKDWMQSVVSGVVANQEAIDGAIQAVLERSWKLVRLDATVRSILRAGAFEILHAPDVPAPVVISNYVDITGDFFEIDEPKFGNAALDAMAKIHR